MKTQKGVRRVLSFALATATVSLLLFTILSPNKANAAAGINQQMAFEGKVVLANGTNITNGTYNMEFKIYNGGTGTGGGTLQWTEDDLVGGSGGVTITNGTFEVNLGAVTSLSSVNFNSDTLWLSLQVGNSTSCTISTTFQSNCGGDGEMTPYIRLTAVPYAFNAMQLGGVAAANFGQLGNAQSWTAANTFSATGGNAIAATGAPTNVATSSLIQFGSQIASGNTTANGGTYLGLNEPSSGAGSVADFLNFQNGGLSKLQVTSTGAITAASKLTVSSGGAAITGNTTIAGILSNLTGLSSTGTITFGSLNTAGVVHTDTSGNLTTGPIVLGTDTSGTYVSSVAAGTGTTVGGTASAPTVNVTYGSSANTAALGSNTITCPTGSGGITGGGTILTIGAATGTCGALTLTSTPTFTGAIIGTGNGDGLDITGAPNATATDSLLQFGGAISGGNSSTNGGTYLGLNEPASGAGSAADILNFENNGTSELKLTSSGALSVNGTYNSNTFTSNGLTFGGAAANTITGASNQSLTIASAGTGQLTIGSASGTLGLSAATTTIQKTASGNTTLDLNDTANTALILKNSGSGIANLDLYGGSLQTGATPVTRLDNSGNLTNIGNFTAAAGSTFLTTGSTGFTFKPGTDNASAFVIQNAGATVSLLAANTSTSTLTVAGLSTAFATLALTNTHFQIIQTTAPTAGTPTTCGTSPTASVATNSTDNDGAFTLTSGSASTSATCQVVITFNKAFANAPRAVILTGGTSVSAKELAAVTAVSTTTFTVLLPNTDTVTTAYQYYYWVVD